MKDIKGREYVRFLSEIRSRIITARIQASHSVNKELIKLYWDIGRNIIERQKKYKWGDAVVEKLANDLKEDFKSTFGFSVQNLWYMRQFYLEYKDASILQRLVGELPWGHNILIFSQVKNKEERMYYLKASIEMGWSRNVLMNQIKAGACQFQKAIPKQHNFSQALSGHFAEQADESLKSVYNLDFLDITKPVFERELERRLVEKVKRFMLELGKGFSFIGNQYRLTLKDNEYFVDLLFYNRILKSLVAVELKTGKFEIEYTAKMDFYLDLLNEQVKLKNENPSIGIILCVRKDAVVVEYAMRRAVNPMGVAEYRLFAHPPKELRAILPSEHEMKAQLKDEIKLKR
jgi:predicted nuclease of restriction endonuclease-like (RecB) superfamily